VASGGVSGPSSVTLGDFLSPAWQKVSSLKSGAGGRRRNRFAPGGRRSKFGQGGCAPPPRSGVVLRGGVGGAISSFLPRSARCSDGASQCPGVPSQSLALNDGGGGGRGVLWRWISCCGGAGRSVSRSGLSGWWVGGRNG
jgi:hypothetical protein